MDHISWNARARLFCDAAVASDGVLGSCVACWRRLDTAQRDGAYIVCDALIWLNEWEAPTPRLDVAIISQIADRQGRSSLILL